MSSYVVPSNLESQCLYHNSLNNQILNDLWVTLVSFCSSDYTRLMIKFVVKNNILSKTSLINGVFDDPSRDNIFGLTYIYVVILQWHWI